MALLTTSTFHHKRNRLKSLILSGCENNAIDLRASNGTRTHDLLITNELLYQLS